MTDNRFPLIIKSAYIPTRGSELETRRREEALSYNESRLLGPQEHESEYDLRLKYMNAMYPMMDPRSVENWKRYLHAQFRVSDTYTEPIPEPVSEFIVEADRLGHFDSIEIWCSSRMRGGQILPSKRGYLAVGIMDKARTVQPTVFRIAQWGRIDFTEKDIVTRLRIRDRIGNKQNRTRPLERVWS